ncbi:MAG: hypothetical protein MUO40_12200 [Anaerolineaceae bacterium]|nr:hypothetical protein [Anaerolineaceae bacterium]
MSSRAVFEGLVFDEDGSRVNVAYIGADAFYVVDDQGFLRHIASQEVDKQVWEHMQQQIEGNEDLLSEQAAKMLGQEDIFTVAMIQNQLKDKEKQYQTLVESGIPEESRSYLGMMGFRVTINLHGEIIKIDQPGIMEED